MTLFQMSERSIVDFVVAQASKSKTPADLERHLSAVGLPDSTAARSFAVELWAKMPRASASSSSSARKGGPSKEERQKAERERAQLHSQRFSLVLDDGPVSSSSAAASPSSSSRRDKGKERERDRSTKHARPASRRKEGDDGWESDEEDRQIKRRRAEDRARADEARYAAAEGAAASSSAVRPSTDDAAPVEDEYVDLDELRRREDEEDRKERDAFDRRMKERDKDKTRKIVEDRSSTAGAEEALRRRALAEDPDALNKLRLRSRQDFLTKREKQQVDLLRLEIADFENDLRAGQSLTKRERRELEQKKEILRLTEERLGINEDADGYSACSDLATLLTDRQ